MKTQAERIADSIAFNQDDITFEDVTQLSELEAVLRFRYGINTEDQQWSGAADHGQELSGDLMDVYSQILVAKENGKIVATLRNTPFDRIGASLAALVTPSGFDEALAGLTVLTGCMAVSQAHRESELPLRLIGTAVDRARKIGRPVSILHSSPEHVPFLERIGFRAALQAISVKGLGIQIVMSFESSDHAYLTAIDSPLLEVMTTGDLHFPPYRAKFHAIQDQARHGGAQPLVKPEESPQEYWKLTCFRLPAGGLLWRAGDPVQPDMKVIEGAIVTTEGRSFDAGQVIRPTQFAREGRMPFGARALYPCSLSLI